MIKTTPLERDLGKHGFVVAYRDDIAGEIVFVRRRSRNVFDRLSLHLSVGDKTASVGAEISIVPGRTALKSLCIHRCLVAIASDKARGITPLPNDEAIRSLFERIRDFGPGECERLADEELDNLLQETATARAAAEKYLGLIEVCGEANITNRVLPDAQREIDRICQQRFVRIPNGERYYRLALQTIAVGCGDVEENDKWLVGRDADTAGDRGLMIRLQLMASRLASERGWELQVL